LFIQKVRLAHSNSFRATAVEGDFLHPLDLAGPERTWNNTLVPGTTHHRSVPALKRPVLTAIRATRARVCRHASVVEADRG
jgi:hypothetical protein